VRTTTHGGPGAAATLATRRPAVLTAQLPTQAFQTLGVTWQLTATAPDLLISVRTRAAGTPSWTAWTVLDQDDDDGTADPVAAAGLSLAQARAAGLRGGTGSLWSGASSGVQVRVVVRSGVLPDDLRLELVDSGSSAADDPGATTPAATTPATTAPATTAPATTAPATTTPATAWVRGQAASTGAAASTGSAASTGFAAAAAGGVREPAILSRAAWGADESRVKHGPLLMPTVRAAVMHHTAGPNNYSRAQVPKIIRGDFAYHLKRGWSDIGYNALVDRFGRIWEGRAGGLSINVMGAHAGGFNDSTFGVSVIGNYDVTRPSAASVEAVAAIMAWKLDLNHRDPFGTARLTSAGGGTARYRAGTTVTLPAVIGHRNTGLTACPGRYLYPYLPAIRKRIKTIMRVALTGPSMSPDSTDPGQPIWISARALATQTWVLTVRSGCDGSTVAQVRGQAGAGRAFTATWNGRTANGALAAPGAYTLTLTSRSGNAIARPLEHTVVIRPPFVSDAPSAEPTTGSGGYQPVTPVRLTDAAGNTSLITGPLSRADVPVLGQAGVPASGVTSVVLNLTVDCTSGPASLEVWPAGQGSSGRAVTSLSPGGPRSVLVTSQVGWGGAVSLRTTAGVAHVTADVVGYYTADGAPLRAVPTTRVLETALSSGPLAAGSTLPVVLPATVDGVSAEQITAVLADVSAIGPAGQGTLRAFGTGDSSGPPSLSFRAGRSTDNLTIVPVRSGAFAVRATGAATNVTVDIRGIVTDGSVPGYGLTAITPVQVLAPGTVRAGTARTARVTGGVTGVPPGATGVLVGITAAQPSASGSIEVFPAGTSPRRGAALRVSRGDARGTVMLVPVGPSGRVALKLGTGSATVSMDVRGYLS
jgi:hypothetical protein